MIRSCCRKWSVGKAARNRRIRKAMMGSKKAARRYRKDQKAKHDAVGMKKIMESAVSERMGKSGIVLPKSGLLVAQLDAKSVDLDNPDLGRQLGR